MKIEQYYLDLLEVEGFIKRYLVMFPDYKNGLEAYEAVERQYESVFKKRKYSDYDTFRCVLTRYNKAKVTSK